MPEALLASSRVFQDRLAYSARPLKHPPDLFLEVGIVTADLGGEQARLAREKIEQETQQPLRW